MRAFSILFRPFLFLIFTADFLDENTLLVSANLFVQIIDKISLVKNNSTMAFARMNLKGLRIPVKGIAEFEKGSCHSIRDSVHAQFTIRT